MNLATKRVTYTRRGLALFFDYLIWGALMTVIYRLGVKEAYFVSTGLYFMLMPYLTGGKTPGKWMVRIQLVGLPADEGEQKPTGSLVATVQRYLSATKAGRQTVGLLPLIVRYGLLYWGVFGLNRLLVFPPADMPSLFRVLLAVLVLGVNMSFFIHVAKRFFRKEPLLFYEKISRTGHAIMLKEPTRDGRVRVKR